jgi:uncharacterized membrane protein
VRMIILVVVMSLLVGGVCASEAVRETPTDESGVERKGKRPQRPHHQRGPSPGGGLIDLLEQPQTLARLGLGEEEAQTLRRQLSEIKKSMRELSEQSRMLARQQAELLRNAETSQAEIMTLVEAIGELHTDMAKLRMTQFFLLRNTLGQERMKEFRKRMGRDRGRGPQQRERSERRQQPDRERE